MFHNTMYLDNVSINMLPNEPAKIYYEPNFIPELDLENIKNWLESMDDFKHGEIYSQPIDRLQKWYQTNNKYFCKNWDQSHERWKSHEYCDYLYKIQNNLQDYLNNKCYQLDIKKPIINSCLINLYRNGNDIISKHSDNSDSFGIYPTIIILSIGETRSLHFEIKEQYLKSNPNLIKFNKSVELENGSLFIMAGSVQKYFYHSIKKEDNKDKRYSLTFREFLL